MYELIKSSLSAYASAAAFAGLWCFLVIHGTFKKTKNTENKKIRTVLRFSVTGVLSGFWLWFFLYVNLFPISLAYYEYNHDSVEEKIGVVESVEQNGKDLIDLVIDNREYRMVYSSVKPFAVIGKDFDEGDTVKIKFGVRSKYIFDIYELNDDRRPRTETTGD